MSEISLVCTSVNNAENEAETEDIVTEETSNTSWAVGNSYSKGDIFTHNGVTYIAMQDIENAQANQAPDDTDMLALYMIYRGEELFDWLYGEYVKEGWQRSYEGVIYECINETAGANIYPPTEAVSVWCEV